MSIYLPFIYFLLLSQAFGTDEFYISAERVSKRPEHITSSLSVISSEMIQNSRAQDLGELLDEYSSFSISRNGGLGSTTSVMMRGASSDYTTVIIDGIRRVDASRTGGGISFENIDIKNIEKIEIIKDAASFLYGADSLAGAIIITTKKKVEKALQLSYGSYDTKDTFLRISDVNKKMQFNFSIHFIKSDGISAFNEKRVVGEAEKDGFNKTNIFTGLTYTYSKNHSMRLSLEHNNQKSEIDDIGRDAPGDFTAYEQNTVNFSSNHSLFDGILKSDLKVGKTKVKRKFSSSSFKSKSESEVLSLKTSHVLYASKISSRFFGLDVFEKKYFDTKNYRDKGVSIYIGEALNFDQYFFDFGVRRSFYKDSKKNDTYKSGAGLFLTKHTNLKVNFSSGYKKPSLYQINDITYGNPSLSGTDSLSSSITLEHRLQSLYFDISYFENRFRSEIAYDFINERYYNIGKSKIEGYELNTKLKIPYYIEWSLGFTKLLARDLENGQHLLRRPREKLHFNQLFLISDIFSIVVKNSYTGGRNNLNGPVGGHVLNGVGINYNSNNNQKVSVEVNNILDRDYEDINTYGTYGRNYTISYEVIF